MLVMLLAVAIILAVTGSALRVATGLGRTLLVAGQPQLPNLRYGGRCAIRSRLA